MAPPRTAPAASSGVTARSTSRPTESGAGSVRLQPERTTVSACTWVKSITSEPDHTTKPSHPGCVSDHPRGVDMRERRQRRVEAPVRSVRRTAARKAPPPRRPGVNLRLTPSRAHRASGLGVDGSAGSGAGHAYEKLPWPRPSFWRIRRRCPWRGSPTRSRSARRAGASSRPQPSRIEQAYARSSVSALFRRGCARIAKDTLAN